MAYQNIIRKHFEMVGLINDFKYWLRKSRYKIHQKLHAPRIRLADLWALDYTLSRLIARCLKKFKKAISYSGSTPIYFYSDGHDGWEEWSAAIDKMIYAFDTYAKHAFDTDRSGSSLSQEEQDKIREGMKFFIEYFQYLNY